MASDEAVLLVRIEAQLRQFERAMARASGTASGAAGRIETRFRQMDRNLGQIGVGFASRFLGPLAALASAGALGQAVNSFQRMQNALTVAGLEGEELANTLARISRVAAQSGTPVESLVQLYSRLSIAQEGLGVNSAEIFDLLKGVAAALRISGKSAEEARGALLQLSQALGSGIVRGEEFNAILDGLLPVAQAAARGMLQAGGNVAKLRQLIIEGKVSSEAFFRAIQAGQPALEQLAGTTDLTLSQAFTNLTSELALAVGKLDDTLKVSAHLVGVMQTLGGVVGDVVDKFASLDDIEIEGGTLGELMEAGRQILLGEVDRLTGQRPSGDRFREITEAGNRARAMKKLVEELENRVPLDLIAGPSKEDIGKLSEAEKISARIQQGMIDAGVEKEPIDLDKFPPLVPPKTGKTPSEKFADDILRIKERTAALKIETATLFLNSNAIGRTTFEREKALVVLDLENEAKKAGLVLTPQLTAQIDLEAAAYARAKVTLEEAEEAQRKFIEVLDEVRTGAGGALSAFNQQIKQGEGLLGGLKSALESVLDTIIRIAEQKAILALFGEGGASGGGILSGLFGAFGGRFVGGGFLGAGKWGIAGERGPELIRGPAHVVPRGGGWGGAGRMNISISLAGATGDQAIAAAARAAAMQGAEMALKQSAGYLREQQAAYG